MIASVETLPAGHRGYLTGRGTAGLIAALNVLGLGGGEVLVPVNLCAIAVGGLIAAGVRPILHDVSPETGNAALDDIAKAWRPGVGGLVAVHNFGEPLDMPSIMAWAHDRGLKVVEDVCNALGATWAGSPVGAFGDAAFYSFGRSKIVDIGDGGAVGSSDPDVARLLEREVGAMPVLSEDDRAADVALEAALRQLRLSGAPAQAHRAAYAAYLPNAVRRFGARSEAPLAAALGDLPANLERRHAAARRWNKALADANVEHRLPTPGSAPWRYNIRTRPEQRDAIVEALRARRLSASTWYPPVDDMFTGAVLTVGDHPGARDFSRTVINLWLDGSVDDAGMELAAEIITGLAGRR